MTTIDEAFDSNVKNFWYSYIAHLSDLLAKTNPEQIQTFIETLVVARESGNYIFVIGNGGSASTASHMANDLAIGTRKLKKPPKIVSLSDNLSLITAIGNDFGYEHVFSRQLAVLAKADDILIAITASGNSPNLINAVKFGKEIGMKTLALTAFDGGELKKIVDVNVHVPTTIGDYGPAEDVHLVLNHFLTSYLKNFLDD